MSFPAVWKKALHLVFLILAAMLAGCEPARRVPGPQPPHRPEVPGATPAPVVLVQPSSSVADPAERNYARRMAVKLAGWLRETGIPATLLDDDSFARALGDETRVIVLVSNQKLGAAEFRSLSRFVRRGGRLVVFNAADPALAGLMGVRLAPRLLASQPGQWSAFRFNSEAPAGIPARIIQDSMGLRPVHPATPSSRVIAWWEDANGRRSPEPAWVRSEAGFWMTHMVLEGDIPAKKQMLAAILGSCDPLLWKAAACKTLRSAGTLGRYPDARQALAAIGKMPHPPQAGSKLAALQTQAEQLMGELTRLHRLEQYDRVLATGRLLDTILMECYARTCPPRRGEFRGLWNHSGTGLYPGNWDATCRVLAQNGMTAIFPHVQRPWSAHYLRTSLAPSTIATSLGDQLDACLPSARRLGIEVHAWVICWNLEGAPAPLLDRYRREKRLQTSAGGETVNWLCPSDPRNRTFQQNAILELASRYNVDGIHLDYIRYPSRDSCFCAGCRQRFEQATGHRVRKWPGDVQSGSAAEAYRRWRAEQITGWLSELRRNLKRAAPAMRLSAAVYPGFPGCRDSIGQDWGEWARRDLVDLLCPMSYTDRTAQFEQWCGTQASFPGVRERLLAGIGVTANESRLNAAQVIDQIAVLRRESLRGFLLFDANRTVEAEVLPFLRMGATADAP